MNLKALLTGAGLVIVVLLVLVVRGCDDDDGPSPAVVNADKFLESREVFRREIVDSLNSAATERKRAEALLTSGRKETPQPRPPASGPPEQVSASDSLAYWKAQYDIAQIDIEGFRVANRRLDSAAVVALAVSHRALALTARTLARLDTANTTIADLRTELDKKEKCLKFLPCPSRTVAFIGGAAAATIVIVAVDKLVTARVNVPVVKISF